MKTTVQTSRGPVRFHSVGEPVVGIPAQPESLATPMHSTNQASQQTSPLPFHSRERGPAKRFIIEDAQDCPVAVTFGQDDQQEDAAFIVRAVNSHAELLAALESLMLVAEYRDKDGNTMEHLFPYRFKDARAAIARATQS